MALSRQDEINSAKRIINNTILIITKEISLIHSLVLDSEKEHILDKDYPLLKKIASLESDIKNSEYSLFGIIDSLATATDSINKKKFLLLDSRKLLELRLKIKKVEDDFHERIHRGFFGTPKGYLIDLYKNRNESEIKLLLSYLINDVLNPLIDSLNTIKFEFLFIEDWLRHKEELREQEENTEAFSPSNSDFETYYHATDDISNFANNSLRREDFHLAKTPAQAIAQKLGFSAGGNFRIVRIKIAKKIADKYVKSADTTDSYADADTNCVYIAKRFIPEINNLIKTTHLVQLELLN
jgi:hypothetical protein